MILKIRLLAFPASQYLRLFSFYSKQLKAFPCFYNVYSQILVKVHILE